MVFRMNKIELSAVQVPAGQPCSCHFAQVYPEGSGAYLTHSLAAYLRAGLSEGQSILVFASSSLWRAAQEQLHFPEARWEELLRSEQLLFVEAHTLIDSHFESGRFNTLAFFGIAARLLERLSKNPRGVRCYNGVSSLLLERQLFEAAEQVEAGWSEQLRRHPSMSLLCSFQAPSAGIGSLLAQHSEVLGRETLQTENIDDLRARVAVLEQRELELKLKLEAAHQPRAKFQKTEQELAQAGKLDDLGELCASIVHELNQPLTVVRGSVEQALRLSAILTQGEGAVDGPEIERWLRSIDEASERMAKIVRNVLVFAHQKAPELRPMALPTVLHRAADLMRDNLNRFGIELKLGLEPREFSIRGDEDLLLQVFLNMLSNARDALAKTQGPKQIEIRTEWLTERGEVLISFADNGSGMDEATLKKVFDPFFTTKGLGVGTGLGLSISQGIIRDHRGRIECESQPGRGTNFMIFLAAERSSVARAA